MNTIQVRLPNNYILTCKRTGVFKTVQEVPDTKLFLFMEQVWEKIGDNTANLSDFDDGSEVHSFEQVELLEEQR